MPHSWPEPEPHPRGQYHECERTKEDEARVVRTVDGWIASDEAGNWMFVARCPFCTAPAFGLPWRHVLGYTGTEIYGAGPVGDEAWVLVLLDCDHQVPSGSGSPLVLTELFPCPLCPAADVNDDDAEPNSHILTPEPAPAAPE